MQHSQAAKHLPCLTNDDGKLPEGQISKNLSSPFHKNISLNLSGKSPLESRPSHPMRGADRESSRTRGGMRWTRQRRARKGLQGGFFRERSAGARTDGAAAHLRRNSPDGTRSGETFGGDGRGRRSRIVLTPEAGVKSCGDASTRPGPGCICDPQGDGGNRARLTGENTK
jgi:hypothetical protein